jgi:hypothetical protein
MYKAEKDKYFDSWHQEDMRTLNKKICINILDPIGFLKSMEELVNIFNTYFNSIEEINLVNTKTIILFGSSKYKNKGD